MKVINGQFLSIVILAAGQGTRMKSDTPKVLHKLAGKPMLAHIVDTAKTLSKHLFIVHGDNGAKLKKAITQANITWVHQAQQLGTGHAVQQALPHIPPHHRVLILVGDMPLITTDTLQALLNIATEPSNHQATGLITAHVDTPTGFGRIIRNQTHNKASCITAIIEEKDANTAQKEIKEINTGIITAPATQLQQWLPNLSKQNAQQEYYLTDIIALSAQHTAVFSYSCPDQHEVKGINTREQLIELERHYQRTQAQHWLSHGVTIQDPTRIDIRGNIQIAQDSMLDINVILIGNTQIGSHCQVGANSIIRNSQIGDHVTIHPFSIIEDSVIESHCEVGPFARIRPNTHLKESVKIGNFVETKQTTLGAHSKANHLAYLGNATIGEKVNIGAGTITCNYDGAHKHQTVIEDQVFVGSNSALVAPITLKKNSTIGAGSVITQSVEENNLALTRSKQKQIDNWQRPKKHPEK